MQSAQGYWGHCRLPQGGRVTQQSHLMRLTLREPGGGCRQWATSGLSSKAFPGGFAPTIRAEGVSAPPLVLAGSAKRTRLESGIAGPGVRSFC